MLSNSPLGRLENIGSYAGFPQIGFSTNVLNHPGNKLIHPGHVVEALDVLSRDFNRIELELSDEAEEAILNATPEEYNKLIAAICDLVARRDVVISLHATWFGQSTNLADRSFDVRQESIKLLKRNIDFANRIGTKTVTCHPGYHQDQSGAEILSSLKSSLSEAAEYANVLGIDLCVENMGDDRPSYVVLDVGEQLQLCEAAGIKIAMDLIHLRSLYDDMGQFWQALDELGPHVANAHIADMKGRKHNHLPIGDGDFELTKALEVLAKHGFSGGAIVEEWVRNRPFDIFLDRAREYRALVAGLTRDLNQ